MMKTKVFLYIALTAAVLILSACAKVGLKDPVQLPGLGENFAPLTSEPPAAKFTNGDIVRYKMLGDKQGIMMKSDYKFIAHLKTWYCIVDFYPSSSLLRLDSSDFDNYERRYVYEFELELVQKYSKYDETKRKRWIR